MDYISACYSYGDYEVSDGQFFMPPDTRVKPKARLPSTERQPVMLFRRVCNENRPGQLYSRRTNGEQGNGKQTPHF